MVESCMDCDKYYAQGHHSCYECELIAKTISDIKEESYIRGIQEQDKRWMSWYKEILNMLTIDQLQQLVKITDEVWKENDWTRKKV